MTRRTGHALVLTLLASMLVAACGGDDDDDSGGDGDADADADGDADAQPQLGASCDVGPPDTCPEGLACMLELGCVVSTCPSNGPGTEHGCPSNGFCYTVDGSAEGYCARVCDTAGDCTEVNDALSCLERSSTEAFSMKVCVLPD